MTFLFTLLRKIPIWIWPLLALAAALGFQTWRLHTAQSTIATQRAQMAAYVSAQATNLAAIAKLRAANAQYVTNCTLSAAQARASAAQSMQFAQAQRQRARSAETRLEAIYAHNQAVRQWSIVPVPRAVRDSLRANAPSGTHTNSHDL